MIKAAIFMGDPLFKAGLSYDVGTCAAGGVSLFSAALLFHSVTDGEIQFDARPAGFSCPSASKIKSYCDASDPYCCNGSNAATHQGYGAEYGSQALAFVKSKLS
jgi:acetylxylan esterase